MKKSQYAVVTVLAAALLIPLAGCHKEGPAEQAGRQLDQTTEKAADKIGQATDDAGRKIEQTGEKIQDAAKADR